ncbi:GNAT family N-acetyltransferase [Streptomyces sp. NPDC056237]|uniref:GNAT family N-acetyltransferase n=1 Tax=Streptomyces sp. NPDC056237 TaxID=3345758 RepID=UPI0035E2D074
MASIRRWCQQGLVVAAEGASGLFGYCAVEYIFFEQGFATTLMVAPSARGRGVGRRLLDAVAASCETQKLFTSTNASSWVEAKGCATAVSRAARREV